MSSAMRRMMGAKKAAQKQAESSDADLAQQVDNLSVSEPSSSAEPSEPSTAEATREPETEPEFTSEPTPETKTEPESTPEPSEPKNKSKPKPKSKKPEPEEPAPAPSGKSKKNKKGKDESTAEPTTPLSVSPPLLNPEHEIKRIYGNIRLWDEDGTAENFTNQLSQTQKKNQEKLSRVWGGKDKRTIPGTTKKLTLVTIKPYWIPQIKSEMSVSRLSADPGAFRFTHSDSYAEGEFQFVQRRAIGQDSADLFGQYPYNVSILNQLAGNGINTGQASSESADLIERALYVFNRALLTSSQAVLGQSKFQFKYVENRQFYRTLYLYIDILARRGLWNTTLEFSKLIYSLDDADYDPYGCRYMMDHFAVQGGDTTAIRYMLEQQLAPQLGYSLALALLLDGKDAEAEEALKMAIKTFPWIGYTLAESLGTPHNHRFDSSGSDSAIEAQAQLYVLRNRTLWDDPKPKVLFTKVWDTVAFDYARNKGPAHWYNMSESLKRHLVISGEPTLLKYAQPLAESDLYDDDPVPPREDVNVYSSGEFAASDVTLAGQNDGTDQAQDGELAPEVVAALAQIQQLCSEAGMDVMEAFQMVSQDVPEAMRGTLLTEVVNSFADE
ncbi:Ribosome quality control complex subunit 1 [Yarrowia sp. B02]|nr:Ribosome quality control complex subunit 1 [Yarrowia sp. B02]